MMKKLSIVACVLLFASAAAFAQTPSPAPLTSEALAAILGQPAAGSCATQPSGVRLAATRRPASGLEKALCTATVNCPSGTVTCSSDVSATSCSAVNRDCSILESGHVTCNGTTTSCTPGCCTGGTVQQNACCRCAATGTCFDCCRCDGGGVVACSRGCSS